MKKILLGLALFATVTAFAQTTKLALKKGQVFEITLTSKTVSEADMMGQTMETTGENTIVEKYEVLEVNGNTIDLQKTVTRMKTDMQMMGQGMSYDSDDKNASGELADAFAGLVGKPKMMQIDVNGNITKEAEKDEAEKNLMQGLGALGQQAGIALINPALLNKSLQPGTSWSDSGTIAADKLTTQTNGTYTLISTTGNTATFQYEGKQQMEGMIEQMGQSMGMKGNTNVKMNIVLNTDTGVINEYTNTTDGKTSIDAMGMTIPATVKSTITAKVKVL